MGASFFGYVPDAYSEKTPFLPSERLSASSSKSVEDQPAEVEPPPPPQDGPADVTDTAVIQVTLKYRSVING